MMNTALTAARSIGGCVPPVLASRAFRCRHRRLPSARCTLSRTRWNATATGVISTGEHVGTTRVTTVKVFQDALCTALRTILRQKHAPYRSILHTWFPKISGCDTPSPTVEGTPHAPTPERPKAWTQTPISAGFASVPIMPVLRNDHWTATLSI